MVEPCRLAAEKALEKEGIRCEIIDLRTLYPVDEEAILASVRKTGRALIVYEAPKTCGYGAEIAALIAERAIEYLEAPVKRVGGFDVPFPYTLEKVYVPDAIRIFLGIKDVMDFA
jgi:2-oxoisovalerate dehydrogenase E1 component beta subunit